MMAAVWRRPSLVALEVAWRWVFGVVALGLLAANGRRVWLLVTGGTGDPARVNLDHFNLTDPMAASLRLAGALGKLLPLVGHVAVWLVPVLLLLWVVVSTLGRRTVMRRIDPALASPTMTLMALGAIRVVCLAVVVAVWFWVLVWCGAFAVTGPALQGEEPSLVLYFALIITTTLVLFVAWAAASWVLSIAPMLAMLRGLGVAASLRAAMRLGPLRGKLVEINLVMGIVKIALVVLAMVFSATPLPFQAFTTDGFLWCWWSGVAVVYLVASDYFHVVRLVACLALCRVYEAR